MPFDDARLLLARHGDNQFQLIEPLIYRGKTDTFFVPRGFITDFASVPRIAVWLIPRFGRFTRAAIVHDYLCATLPIDPVDTDGVFRRIMKEEGVGPVRRHLMWTGVRWGALTDRRRRPGWWRAAPTVFAITTLALPLAIPMLAVAAGLLLYAAAELIVSGGQHSGSVKT